MTDPKSLFQKNKELFGKWSAVAHSDWFAEVLVYARGAFLDARLGLNEDSLYGAKEYERILCDLAETEAGDIPAPKIGLQHDLDSPRVQPKAK